MELNFKNWRFIACIAGAMIFMFAVEPFLIEPALGIRAGGALVQALRGGLGALLGYGLYWLWYGRNHPPPKRP